MKRLLLLISFSFLFLYSFTQTDVQRDSRVSPILKQALASKSGYYMYGRTGTARFINIAVLNESSHTLCWFTCHGRLFDSTKLTVQKFEQVTSKQLDPFILYQNICNKYLADIAAARDIYRVYGDIQQLDKLNGNYRALLAMETVQAAKTQLQKLIAIENVRKKILTQFAYLNCVSPFILHDDPLYKISKEQAGAMIQTKDSTVYCNIDPTSAVAKISLYKKSAGQLYIQNRFSEIIDSVALQPEKYDLLQKEKTDVFLLYRGWLELQWQGALAAIRRQRAGPYNQVYAQNEKEVKELYSQLNAISTKINQLNSPEAKSIEQAVYDTYKSETSEIAYIPLLGIAYTLTQTRGVKEYELTNHLGNVLATVSDKKIGVPSSSNSSLIDHYEPDIVSAQDYYPFGMLQPGRSYLSPNGDKYRYGFNGKENDNEVEGEGNQQDYGMRIYDPRLGRFLSVDPITRQYPQLTPYQYASNTPIQAVDLDGLEALRAIEVSEEEVGKSKLRVVYKEGNGKVVKMVTNQANSRATIVNVLKLAGRGGILAAISEIFSSPTTSPQDVAKDYPGVAGTPNEDKFWDHWIGPGRNFPLPPIDPAQRPQWLSDYWPEGMPINLPNPKNVPHVDVKPIDDEDDNDENYITLYRGVGEGISPKELYTLAEKGIAYPKGLLPGKDPHSVPDDHTWGDTESIYTSWTSSEKVAEGFARGGDKNTNGVILKARFKKSDLIRSRLSQTAKYSSEQEYLVPGVVDTKSTPRRVSSN
jgi:RHS repeat-associated protein